MGLVGLPGGPMLDEHWAGLLPNHVLTGFPSTAFGGLVDAGVAVGWLHHAAAFSKRSFLGRGWLTVSTFDLTSRGRGESACAASYEGAGRELNPPQQKPTKLVLSGKTSTLHMDTTDLGGTRRLFASSQRSKNHALLCPRRWKVGRESLALIRRAGRGRGMRR